MGGSCVTCGGEGRCIQCFNGEILRGRDNVEDLGVDGTITLKCTFKKSDGAVDWTDLAQNGDWGGLL